MWKRSIFRVLAVLIAIGGLGVWATRTAVADAPTEGVEQTILEPLPPVHTAAEQESVTLSARLYDGEGQALGGEELGFYIVTPIFGRHLMKVGEVLTDATGTASLLYKPTWQGDHTVVVRYGGRSEYAPVQTSYHFSFSGPVPVHEDALFGLESVRWWAPFGVGLMVLVVWGTLGLVTMRTVLGIPAGAPTEEPVPAPAPIPVPTMAPARPAPFARVALVLAAVLVLVAMPTAWLLTRDGGEQEVWLSTETSRFTNGQYQPDEKMVERPAEKALPATLVRSVPATTTEAGGQITSELADLPTDVAVIQDRVFILDTNKGRILAVTPDGKLAPILESARGGDMSLWGATAMTVHNGMLYVANSLAGNIMVVAPSGRIEGLIKPQAPEAQQPLRPTGIAVTNRGQIWLSDSDNHRILFVNTDGEFLGMIGEGVQSSGEYGFNTPGGLALDRQGNLWVADTLNHQVKKYSPMGVFLMAIGEDRLIQPEAVAVDEAGDIFVSDDGLMSVLVFAPDGTYLGSIGRAEQADGEPRTWFQAPHGLKVKGELLYVMDRLAGMFVFDLGGGNGR